MVAWQLRSSLSCLPYLLSFIFRRLAFLTLLALQGQIMVVSRPSKE